MPSSSSLHRLPALSVVEGLPALGLSLLGAAMVLFAFLPVRLHPVAAEEEPNQCVLPSCASFCKTDGGQQSCVRLCGSFPFAVTPWEELCPPPLRLASFECSFSPTSCTYTCASS